MVSISGMVNGASTQFTTILAQVNTDTPTYLISQQGTTFEKSQIPVDVIKQIDTSYFNSYTPIIYKQALSQNNESLTFIYANFTTILQDVENFILIQGSIPTNSNQTLLGEGLRTQYFSNLPIPSQITLTIDNKTVTKTITGVFSDNSIYDYSILENINYVWNNINSVSMYMFQIKTYKVLSGFESQTQNMTQSLHPGLKLDFSPLQKTGALGQAFYNDIYNLFFYLELIMIILLALKITHASYTLFYRYYEDFLTLRILGMSNKNLQVIFYLVLLLIGNVGLIYGFVAGIALPHIFLLMIRMVIKNEGLYVITPNIQEILLLFTITNVILLINSFWIAKMHLQEKLVPKN